MTATTDPRIAHDIHWCPIHRVTRAGAEHGSGPLAWEWTSEALRISTPEPVRRSVGKIADNAIVLRTTGSARPVDQARPFPPFLVCDAPWGWELSWRAKTG